LIDGVLREVLGVGGMHRALCLGWAASPAASTPERQRVPGNCRVERPRGRSASVTAAAVRWVCGVCPLHRCLCTHCMSPGLVWSPGSPTHPRCVRPACTPLPGPASVLGKERTPRACAHAHFCCTDAHHNHPPLWRSLPLCPPPSTPDPAPCAAHGHPSLACPPHGHNAKLGAGTKARTPRFTRACHALAHHGGLVPLAHPNTHISSPTSPSPHSPHPPACTLPPSSWLSSTPSSPSFCSCR
jgi:hypothetical protein